MSNKQIRIAIAGAGGRMGRQLTKAALHMNSIVLSVILERKGYPLNFDKLVKINRNNLLVQSDIKKVISNFDILIDFTCPKVTLRHLKFCRQYGRGMIIGTTGFDNAAKKEIKEASTEIPIVFSANFSTGINVMFKSIEKIAKMIGYNTDIEIIEAHHRNKLDRPSGTALTMGKIIAHTLNKDLQSCLNISKNRINKRMFGGINFVTIRAGDIVGEHTVMFTGFGERIEITHKTSNRIAFANGAIKAALWLKDKKTGIFDMCDVLGFDS